MIHVTFRTSINIATDRVILNPVPLALLDWSMLKYYYTDTIFLLVIV